MLRMFTWACDGFGAAWLPGRTLGGAGTKFLDPLQAHDEASRAEGAR